MSGQHNLNFIALLHQEQLIHCAAEGGLSDLVEKLLSQNIDINTVDEVRLN